MADVKTTDGKSAGVTYTSVDVTYFEQRALKRHARVWSLWALGVGAVISGHFSGWNLGIASGGWGGMFIAAVIIAIMYLGLTFSIAEMSPALPHTGAAYSFARTTMGPWGGFVTGLCENVEYVITPAVVVSFIGSYMGSIFGTPPEFQPVYWIFGYIIFVGLNVVGVELSFRVTLVVTLAALACLVAFWVSALPVADFSRWALNIGVGPDGTAVELPNGGGPFLPFGLAGAFGALPFAVWLFLAIEQLPLAAEESVDPKTDMPKGIMAGMATLIVSAFMILWAEFVGGERRVRPVHLAGTAAGRLQGHLRHRPRQAAGGGGGDRPDRFVPHHHLCSGAADLLAVAGRLLSARPLHHPRRPARRRTWP